MESQWTTAHMPNQTGRIAIVTGANSGLGYETTRALAKKGAHIIMACRNVKKGTAARDAVLREVPRAELELMTLDLGSLASVREFASTFTARYSQLDMLVNNAGLMAIPRAETEDGFEMQIGVNHLGHFALTGLLLPVLANTAGSRVVNVSSMASYYGTIHFDDLHMKRNYTRYGAYGQSKLANVLFTFELQRKLEAAGSSISSMVAHPGYSATNLQATSAHGSNSRLEALIYGITNNVLAQSQAQGALPQLFAATAPDAKPGAFYGPNFMGVRGYPKEVRASANAYDTEAAARLWQLSEELTGVRYTLPEPANVV